MALTVIKPSGLALTGEFTVADLTATANLTAGNLKTDNLLYANGSPYVFGSGTPGGANTQIQFNDANSFAGSANLTFDKTTNTLSVTNIIANGAGLTSLTGANVTGQVSNATVASTVYTNAQPNITSVGTLTDLNVSGSAVIGGNLTVNGDLTYVNVTNLSVEDPIIQLQTGPNAAAPTSNSGKDVGSALNYYDSSAKVAFMGWDVSNAEFGFGDTVSITNEVVTFTSYGNVRAGYFLGNGSQLTGITASGGNATNIVNGNSNVVVSANSNVSVSVAGKSNISTFSEVGLSVGLNAQATRAAAAANTALYVVGNVSSDAPPILIQNRFATGYSSMDFLNSSNTFMGAVGAANPSATSVPALANLSYLYGASGASGVGIYATTGNVTISANSNANIVTVTGTGANVSGTVNVTGNLSAANANLGNIIRSNYASIGGSLAAGAYQLYVKSNGINGTFALQSNIGGYAEVSLLNSSETAVGGIGYAGSSATYYPNQAYFWSGNGIAFSGNGYSATGGTKNMFINGSGIVTIPTSVNSTNTTTGALVVTGGIGVSANVYANAFYGNATGLSNIPGANVTGTVSSATTASTVTTNSQPNITSVGALTELTSNGTIDFTNASNVSLGSVSNLKITGGTANYVLKTDGAGNLSWVAQSGGAGGTPGGTNTQVQFNDSDTFAGSANFTFDKTSNTLSVTNIVANGSGLTSITGANVTGQVGNALVASTVYTNAQPNITSVGTLTSLAVSGNAEVGNLITGGGSGGNLSGANYIFANYFNGTIVTPSQPNITTVGVLTSLNVSNSIVSVQTDSTGGAPTSNSGKDVGTALNYFDNDGDKIAFVGWDVSNAEIVLSSNTTISNQVATFNQFANVRAGNFIGNGSQLTGVVSATVTSNAQPNITSLGTLANLTSEGTIDFTNSTEVSLGAVSNLKITGGAANFVLSTDGTGNLSWVVQSGGGGGGGGSLTLANTSSNATFYPVFANATSGDMTVAYLNSSLLTFNPSTGTLTAQDLNTLSDATLKDNVEPISDPFEVIKQILGVGFTWKNSGKKSYGVIAQMIEKILPELVTETPDGKKTVNYIPIIAFLLEAVKRQQEDIDILKKR